MSMAAHRFNNGLRYRDDMHPNQAQLTPPYVLEPIRASLGGVIDLDPCTEPDNPTGATRFYSLPVDGAAEPWDAKSIFCNPPYSKARERWVKRCAQAGKEGRRVALLMPAATDTKILQFALRSAGAGVLLQGRVKFGLLRANRRQAAASHGSIIIGWNVDLAPCANLGIIISAGRAK